MNAMWHKLEQIILREKFLNKSYDEKFDIKEAQKEKQDIPLGTLIIESIPRIECRLKLWAYKLNLKAMEKDNCKPLKSSKDVPKKYLPYHKMMILILKIPHVSNLSANFPDLLVVSRNEYDKDIAKEKNPRTDGLETFSCAADSPPLKSCIIVTQHSVPTYAAMDTTGILWNKNDVSSISTEQVDISEPLWIPEKETVVDQEVFIDNNDEFLYNSNEQQVLIDPSQEDVNKDNTFNKIKQKIVQNSFHCIEPPGEKIICRMISDIFDTKNEISYSDYEATFRQSQPPHTPRVTKNWIDVVTIPLLMAYTTRYISGTDKIRPNAFEVRGMDGSSTGVVHYQDTQLLTQMIKLIMDYTAMINTHKATNLNRMFSTSQQITFMTWVAEGIINPDQPWQSLRPRTVVLSQGSDGTLGISIKGGREHNLPILMSRVTSVSRPGTSSLEMLLSVSMTRFSLISLMTRLSLFCFKLVPWSLSL